ncbi:hypothetical protein [Dokdonia sp. PRO95]|uniref:hypothetical protein n=1 Tax=Dokdonia sp. PRO95 TaxID=1239415 RepID=UPI00055076C0|nr:hypothetical protein [Dokdonia sp. PRO95]
MKYTLFLLTLLCILTGCTQKEATSQETVAAYYKAVAEGNYKEISSLISDSITITAGDYVMPFDKESYYEHFKWDSIFKPSYEVVSIENDSAQVIATVAVSSLRFEFLKNNPLTCSHNIYLHDGKITKLEEITCIDVNWDVWQQERDSLVAWTARNHPELDNFINDLSMKGAIKYKKAMELYVGRGAKD